MAIFSMNENYYDESDDILDNMLEACDQMMDALNETGGGARAKYLKMEKEKYDKAESDYKKEYKALEDGKRKDFPVKEYDKSNNHYNNLEKYGNDSIYWAGKFNDSNNPLKTAGKPYTRDGYYNDTGAHKNSKVINYNRVVSSKEGKKNFMRDFGGPYNYDKYPHKFENADTKWKQDHNKIELEKHFEKKKAIKETCLTILSMIDDI